MTVIHEAVRRCGGTLATARALHVSEGTVRAWMRQGVLRPRDAKARERVHAFAALAKVPVLALLGMTSGPPRMRAVRRGTA